MARFLSIRYLLAFFTTKAFAEDPRVYVDKLKTTYIGKTQGSSEHFRNIKFGQDTSGQGRFAPPVPFLPKGEEFIDAASPGPACPQLLDALPPFFSEIDRISEDCLNLYIARPKDQKLTSKSKLPVVVWVHGGGVVKGSAYDSHTTPEKLLELSVRDDTPVIFAAINYRLSIFGFARTPTLREGKSLNVGMRDQRLGLQWIQDHIEAFGGDSNRITAYGLSSGGTFISLQQMAYGGKNGVPFQQAWMMSGPPGTAINTTSNATTLHTVAIAEKLGCNTSKNEDTLPCLREVDMQTLLDTTMTYSIANHPPNGLFTFIPSTDDDFLPDRPSKLLRSGSFATGINSVFGWTQDDGAINAGAGHLITSEEDMVPPIKNFAHALTDDHYARLFALYTVADFEEDVRNYNARKRSGDPNISVHYFRVARILRDLLFTCSSFDFSRHMMRYGPQNFSSVRLYDLNQSVLNPMWNMAGMPYVGVSHGSDTNYIFDGIFPEGTLGEDDIELSEAFTRSLIHFAYTGNPSSTNSFKDWPPAYENFDIDATAEAPRGFNLLIIGGPLGSAAVSISVSDEATKQQSVDEPGDDGHEEFKLNDHVGKMQQVLDDVVGFGGMGSAESASLKKHIEHQKLLQRCGFINTLDEILGN
ncbi:MAG: hypothetical protein M1822_008638 [Bathelium mastoideum]|nr:MAG: hypothetical protein M1822_008638 [Bathelium mastoideum]